VGALRSAFAHEEIEQPRMDLQERIAHREERNAGTRVAIRMHDGGEDHHLDVRMMEHKLRNDQLGNGPRVADCGDCELHELRELANIAFQAHNRGLARRGSAAPCEQ
jgi:hypothetical protein